MYVTLNSSLASMFLTTRVHSASRFYPFVKLMFLPLPLSLV